MKTLAYTAIAASALALSGQADAATLFSGTGSGFFIPLGKNTQTSTIDISSAGDVQSISFTLDLLAHTSARDLTATITHDGVTATLFSGLTGLRGLLGNYSFTSDAPTTMNSAPGFLTFAPGTYKYSFPVAGTSFAGLDASGDWTLKITDSRVLGVGGLAGWTLSGTAGGVPEPATWAMMILGMGLVGFAMRRQKANVRVSYAA